MTAATISEHVRALHAGMAAQPPNELTGAFAREQSALARSGVPDGVVPVGSTLPDVVLIRADGAATSLHTVSAGRPAVVVFYRGAWCPYCNITLRNYQDRLLPALVRRGVELMAISGQLPDESLSMQQKNDLTFIVLSDPANSLARHMGILSAPSSEVRAAQLQLGLDLTAINADGTTAVAMPTVVIVDAGHVVRWIDVHPDYTTRSEADEILVALDAPGL